MGLSSVPATNTGRPLRRTRGRNVDGTIEQDVTPLKIITKTAIENAIAGVAATGGSTNAVLHFWPCERAKVPLSI